MTAPGTTITVQDTPVQHSAPTDTGQVVIAGLSDRGSITAPIPVLSLADFVTKCGDRQTYSGLYDWIETYFREGGNKALVCRVVGPTPTQASLVLQDVVPANTMTVKAINPGSWGAGLKVAIAAGTVGGTYNITVTDGATAAVLEKSPDFPDKPTAYQWASANSKYIALSDLAGTGNPAVLSATSLSGGSDDRGNIVDANWKSALDRATPDYGPGQAVQCGRTTTQAYTDTLSHAVANNRVAILDTTDTPTSGTMISSAAAARATTNGRFGAMYGPWAIVPGLPTSPLTTRIVPWSAVQCGLIARSEGAGKSPNVPVAGENGQARFAIGVSQPGWDITSRDSLNTAGVNIARVMYGGVRTYGMRSLTDPVTDPNWNQFSNCREAMRIKALGNLILERHMFAQIDGEGFELGKLRSELDGMLLGEYGAKALFGATPQDAFSVDVDTVNTPLTISQHKLTAAVAARFSPGAEQVNLILTNVPITESVA